MLRSVTGRCGRACRGLLVASTGIARPLAFSKFARGVDPGLRAEPSVCVVVRSAATHALELQVTRAA